MTQNNEEPRMFAHDHEWVVVAALRPDDGPVVEYRQCRRCGAKDPPIRWPWEPMPNPAIK